MSQIIMVVAGLEFTELVQSGSGVCAVWLQTVTCKRLKVMQLE